MATVNNWTEKDVEWFPTLEGWTRMRICKEVGKKKETPHLHVMIVFRCKIYLSSLKTWHSTANWTAGKCAEFFGENYTNKFGESEIVFDEDRRQQGKRSDLDIMHDNIMNGMDLKTISNEHFSSFVKYTKGIQAYFQLNSKPRDFITEVIVLWGDSGTGKTRKAVEAGARKVHYKNGFFYGQVTADIVLFDEFDECDMTRSLFLEITDRYECEVNVKGGSINWRPKTIYLTSNSHPNTWMLGWDEAIQRRITKIIHMEHQKDRSKNREPK